eukprot:TRINITY_DN23465_c0_g2_i1.p1 TRINITY_DN23465_c0_g2~~TRINITY_DN23465_c0_g2_i1.p1  ORF type:complete len:405 (+),score=45.08 TRINITY_DN23465_c0_g2_i1:53-1216(+)
MLPGALTEPEPETYVGSYELLNRLGGGRRNVVYRAVDKAGLTDSERSDESDASLYHSTRSHDQVVVKVASKEGDRSFLKEKKFLSIVRGHPNVASLLTSYDDAIVMPLYGQVNLFWRVLEGSAVSESKAARLTCDILSALQHVHSFGIIHRNVKPGNISLTDNGRAVLLDFENACYCSDTIQLEARVGSPGYVAPEVIQGKQVGTQADVFSAGCVAYFMLAQVHPFSSTTQRGELIFRRTLKCDFKFCSRFDDVSDACKNLISSLVVREPNKRLSIEASLKHGWIADHVSMMKPHLQHIGEQPEEKAVDVSFDSGTQLRFAAIVPSMCKATRTSCDDQTMFCSAKSGSKAYISADLASRCSRGVTSFLKRVRSKSVNAPSRRCFDRP